MGGAAGGGELFGGGVGAHDRAGGQLQAGGREEGEPPDAAVGAEEVLDEVVRRVGQQLGGRCELGEPAAGAHHRDHGAQFDGLVDVVGDEDDGLAQFVLDAQEFVLQSLADHGVDGGERLVHEQHGRIGGERPGHADALLLTAGELVRVPLGEEASSPTRSISSAARSRDFCLPQPIMRGTVAMLSRIVRCWKSPAFWMTYPMDRRSVVTGCCWRSSPSSRIVPSVGSTILLIIRRVVVLPQPEGPTSTVIARSGISSDSRSTATVPSGYRLVTESIRIKTPNTLRVWQKLPAPAAVGGAVAGRV